MLSLLKYLSLDYMNAECIGKKPMVKGDGKKGRYI